MHGRPPAFQGVDGASYTVSAFIDDAPGADGRYGAALLFVRWSAGGARAAGHLETDYLAFGATPEEAAGGVLTLTLHQVKAHLDRLCGLGDASVERST